MDWGQSFLTLGRALIEPYPSVTDSVERRHGQLVAGLMVLVLPFGYLVAVFPLIYGNFEDVFDSDLLVLLGSSIIWTRAYSWSRSGRAKHAAQLAAWSASAAIITTACLAADHSDVRYLIMPLLFSSVILPVRSTLTLVVFDLLGVALMPVVVPQFKVLAILEFEFSFLLIGAVMILGVNWYRNRLEQDRDQVHGVNTERLRTVLEKMPVMLAAVGEDGTLAVWNEECERVTGYQAAEVIGNPEVTTLLYPDVVAQHKRDHAAQHSYRDWERETRCKDGTMRTIAWSSIAAEQSIAGWKTWGVGVDVTARQRAEGQRLELAIERQRVDVLKQFLDTASHDLRTPLTTLKTTLYLLQRIVESGQVKQHLDVAEQQVDRLVQLLEDMLEALRVDAAVAAQVETLHPLDINVLLGHILAVFGTHAQNKQLDLRFEPEYAALEVFGDARGLRIAMGNIIENAVHFSPPHEPVVVRTFRKADNVVVVVEDRGPGIADKDLPRIFEHFFRADAARQSGTGGAGLGLTVARKIVEAHGGLINVESQEGEGSTFVVQLPLSSGATNQRPVDRTDSAGDGT